MKTVTTRGTPRKSGATRPSAPRVKTVRAREPSEKELISLEKRSKAAADTIRSRLAGPWIVEFAGMPNSGKSGCIATITHFLRHTDHPVLAPFEGASQAPEYLKSDLTLYNSWTASYAVRQIIEGSRVRAPSKYDFVLLDRGLLDATAWFRHLGDTERGRLQTKAKEVMTNFVCLDHWRMLVQQVFVFVCTPKISLKRELDSKLIRKDSLVHNEETLEQLKRAYSEACECYCGQFDITIINTDDVTSKAAAYAALNEMFKRIEVIRLESI